MTAAKTAVRATEERKPPGVRELAAQATRESILKAAIKVFSKNGFDGGRVEQISRAAKSYDRMIYYYFGSKEGLYIAALEEIYRRFNDAESELQLDESKPRDALREVIRFMWSYYLKHPEFITLLNTENLHRGKHIGKSERAREYSSPAVGVIERVLRIGAGQGLFRPDLTARDLYLTIAGLCYFYLSNRFTLSAFLGEDLEAPAALQQWQAHVIDTVERTVAPAMAAVSITSKGNGHG
jgi:AcrR family transcriptional regulator